MEVRMTEEQEMKLNIVLSQVKQRRFKQHSKFGEQNCPSLDQDILNGYRVTRFKMAEEYKIPTAKEAQNKVDDAMSNNRLTYADILIEEVCEVVDCMSDEDSMREELLDVAAVAIQWIEAIDRRKNKRK